MSNDTNLIALQHWCDKHEAAKITGLSPLTLRDWRLSGKLIEGIHWIKLGARCVRYNVSLLRDYMATYENPEHHQRAVHNYLTSLPSNHAKKSGRKPT